MRPRTPGARAGASVAVLATLTAASALCGRPARAATAADFATRLLAYDGTGGVSGYTSHPERTLGAPSTIATPTVPDNTSLFSFGWGGYLVLGFDRPITDDPRHPGGYDFIVFGNSLYAGGDNTVSFREPGYVEVGVDPSGRHEYGDGSQVQWYWLKGSPAPQTRAGFPIAPPDADTPLIGYADCTPTDGSGDPLVPDDPTTPGITPGTAGGDAFDLAWAVDAGGNPVHLASADFVRISCAVDAVVPVLGRYSTEVDAVSLVRPRVMGDVDGDNAVTVADAALALRAAEGLLALTGEPSARADMDGDGQITPSDAAAILARAGGLSG